MNLKEITFVEQYIDEKPKENYWRGIGVNIGELRVLNIEFEEGYNVGEFYLTPKLVPLEVIQYFDTKQLIERKRYKTKEQAKEAAITCITNYVKLFINE